MTTTTVALYKVKFFCLKELSPMYRVSHQTYSKTLASPCTQNQSYNTGSQLRSEKCTTKEGRIVIYVTFELICVSAKVTRELIQ